MPAYAPPRARRLSTALQLTVLAAGLLGGLSPAEARKPRAEAARQQTAPYTGPDCRPPRCAVTVSGNEFLKDGKPWVPKGAVITGFLAPKNYIRGTYAKAREVWGDLLLNQLREAGVDTVRITVGAAGLDPTNPMGDRKMDAAQKKAYLDDILAAVDLAERHGMNSLVNITTGGVTGFATSEETPGPEAARAWTVLAPLLANRPSVFFDAFNEPGFGGGVRIDADASPWQRWRSGYQLMVDTIRKSGARNVIVLDGISVSRIWRKNTDANLPNDPVRQLAFDIHPYPTDAGKKTKTGLPKLDYFRVSDVERSLDGWCDRHACIATEFFTGVGQNPDKANCYDSLVSDTSSPQIAQAFLDYFSRKRIGVFVFTGDWKHRLFDRPGEPGAQLTSFANFTNCQSGDKNVGPGELMKKTWLSQR